MREHIPYYPPIGLDRKSEEWRDWRHSYSRCLERYLGLRVQVLVESSASADGEDTLSWIPKP